MSNHSPFPWDFKIDDLREVQTVEKMKEYYPDFKLPYRSLTVFDDEGGFVADCGSHKWTHHNADIIASIPDIIEENKRLKETLQQIADKYSERVLPEQTLHRIHRINPEYTKAFYRGMQIAFNECATIARKK